MLAAPWQIPAQRHRAALGISLSLSPLAPSLPCLLSASSLAVGCVCVSVCVRLSLPPLTPHPCAFRKKECQPFPIKSSPYTRHGYI